MYWAHGQRILRAAHQIRRAPGIYAVYCSNYSCGPDSFNLHFFAYIMDGKPFAIIETDGHAGDAGTKTRIEAFLHCVAGELKATAAKAPNRFAALQPARLAVADFQRDQRILIPPLGPNSDVLAAGLRGLGYRAETLPPVDAAALRLGRRFTSGKECVPMCMTLGGLLQRMSELPADELVIYALPGGSGPCRFGVYNLLNQLTLERAGLRERVHIWAQHEEGYFDRLPPGFALLVFAGFTVADALQEMLLEVRPGEKNPGAAQTIYERATRELHRRLEDRAMGDLGLARALWQVVGGNLFGLRRLLTQAAREFAAARGETERPRVLVVGEIYVRSNAFANDHVVARLEERGLRVALAPCGEFIEYVDHLNHVVHRRGGWSSHISMAVQDRVRALVARVGQRELGMHPPVPVAETLAAAGDYLPVSHEGEAVLTLGAALHHWRAGRIDAVVNVGPLECMPTKVAEAQFFHIAQKEGLPTLTLALNGDPLNPEALDNFVFEVQERFRRKVESSCASVNFAGKC
jgi:predicted nucleotide-binding protein (sugar kinase/HSP70/actin superfamily)